MRPFSHCWQCLWRIPRCGIGSDNGWVALRLRTFGRHYTLRFRSAIFLRNWQSGTCQISGRVGQYPRIKYHIWPCKIPRYAYGETSPFEGGYATTRESRVPLIKRYTTRIIMGEIMNHNSRVAPVSILCCRLEDEVESLSDVKWGRGNARMRSISASVIHEIDSRRSIMLED